MKRKTLRVSAESFADFLKNPVPPGITQTGMPADARIVWARFDGWTNTIKLLIASAEFESDGGDFTLSFHRSENVGRAVIG